MDHPKDRRERETHTHAMTDRERVCLFVCLCVINCQKEWLAAQGSGQNSVVLLLVGPVSRHCLWPWLPSANTSDLKFSYYWYGWKFTHYIWPAGFFKNMGEFLPRMYSALNMYMFIIFKFSFFTNVLSQTYIIFLQAQVEKVVNKVMKFPFHNWTIYQVTIFLMNLWVNFHS